MHLIDTLKILTICLAIIFALWDKHKDIKDKIANGSTGRRTDAFWSLSWWTRFRVFCFLFILITVLSFFTTFIEDRKNEKDTKASFKDITTQTTNLLSSTERNINTQFYRLNHLNEILKFQNETLKLNIHRNQLEIYRQFKQSEILQNQIQLLSQNGLKKIDSASSYLGYIGNQQNLALTSLQRLSALTKENINQLTDVSNELAAVSSPISPFKLKFLIALRLKDTSFIPLTKSKFFSQAMGNIVPLVFFEGGESKPYLGEDAMFEYPILNFEDYEQEIKRYQIHHLNFHKDTNSKKAISNTNKIWLNYTVDIGFPYYLYGFRSIIYQPIEFTVNGILENPYNLRNLYELFSDLHVSVNLFKLSDKNNFFQLKVKNTYTNKVIEKPMIIDSAYFLPQAILSYGPDFSLQKKYKDQELFTIPYVMETGIKNENQFFDILNPTLLLYIKKLKK